MIQVQMIKKAQSLLEYAMLIGTIAAAFIAMNIYINRAVNAKLHNIESEIGDGKILINDPN
ncbi:MAG: hypothetical protein QMD94_00690 [Candidatus Omnitrophota bacterium]|nr:hypothetical protein [Candidatus Omnitrophota bacterium]